MTETRKRRRWFTTSGKQRVFQSQQQAANALKVPIELIREAMRAGCSAFRSGGRIDRAPLARWIRQNGVVLAMTTKNRSLRDVLLTEQARKLRIENDRREGILVARADVCSTLDRILGRAMPEVERLLIHELPIQACGSDVPSIRATCQRYSDMVRSALYACEDEWKW